MGRESSTRPKGFLRRPRAPRLDVTGAERARKVAGVGDRELHHARSAQAKVRRLGPVADRREAGAAVEEQEGAVEREAAEVRKRRRDRDVVLWPLRHCGEDSLGQGEARSLFGALRPAQRHRSGGTASDLDDQDDVAAECSATRSALRDGTRQEATGEPTRHGNSMVTGSCGLR
jgi:hypothetical protein